MPSRITSTANAIKIAKDPVFAVLAGVVAAAGGVLSVSGEVAAAAGVLTVSGVAVAGTVAAEAGDADTLRPADSGFG